MTATLAPILVLPGDADRDEWLARRRLGVGASDVAAILGISPYQGPLHVWLDKTGQLDWDGNAATKWGSRFEDDVLDEFIEGHPELIVTPSPGMYAAAAEPWRTASLDGEALGERGLEVVEIKGLALDTPIPTPTGWATMRSLSIGDHLFDSRGAVCTVTAKSEVKWVDCYRLKFDDGTSIVCDADHRWPVVTGVAPRYRAEVLDTRTIAATLRGRDGQRQHRILLADAISLPDADLPIEPYTLGCWLGDGSKDCGRITGQDQELFALVEEASGLHVGLSSDKREGACPSRTVFGLRTLLRKAGLLRDKHIPAAYMRASAGQRIALLRGLMDTDGTWARSRQQAVFVATDKALAEQVRELVLSLGERATLVPVQVTGYGKTVTAYRVVWRPRRWNPFRLTRKANLVGALGGRKVQTNRRLVVSADPALIVPTQCITVDSPDHTYLCGDQFLPTHNTTQMRHTTDEWGEPGTDEIPLYYLCQVTWQCAVRGAGWWRLAVLSLDDLEDYREYEGAFSPTLAGQLRDRVAAWREVHILNGVEPAADGLADTTSILGALADTRLKPTKGEIGRDALLWQTGAITNHQAVNEFAATKDEYINLLRQAMLAAGVEEGQVNGITVATWKPNRSGKRTFRVKGI